MKLNILFSALIGIYRESWLRMGLQHTIHRNKNYLRRNNMEIAGYNSGLQVIRHKPGKSNDVNVISIKKKNAGTRQSKFGKRVKSQIESTKY